MSQTPFQRRLFWVAVMEYGQAILMVGLGVLSYMLISIGHWAAHQYSYSLTADQIHSIALLIDFSWSMLFLSIASTLLLILTAHFVRRNQAHIFCHIMMALQAVILFPIGTAVSAYYYRTLATNKGESA